MTNQELPFTAYPGGGRELLKRRPGWNTRRSDGPEFMQITGAKSCAYCGLDMTGDFDNWLTMVLDHVVPVSVCQKMGIDGSLAWNYSNTVLACGACNGFCNRYEPKEISSAPTTLTEFYDLRDRIFAERWEQIHARREEEQKFFETKPWIPKHSQTTL